MKMYADTPARRTRQLVGDLLFVAWLAAWVWVGGVVHESTLELAGPGESIAGAATRLGDGLAEAGGRLDDVPLVGDGIALPFDKAAGASAQLAAAGRAEVRAAERLAFWLGLSIAAIPMLVVAAFYVPGRMRFSRRATAGARFVDAAEDLDLFALRALANQPMHVLARISDDPAGAWRRRDADVVRRLGELELRSCGLKPPRSQRPA